MGGAASGFRNQELDGTGQNAEHNTIMDA